MPNTNSGAPAADLNQLTAIKISGRTLNTIGVAMLAFAVASFMCGTDMPAMTRLAGGFSIAALAAVAGQMLLRFGAQGNWLGSMLIGCGYGLSYFFASTTFDTTGLSSMESPYWSWTLALLTAGAACVQTNKNRILYLPGMIFTLGASAEVLFAALNSQDSMHVAGTPVSVSALASVLGMLWWSALSAIYKHFEKREAAGAEVSKVQKLTNRVGHELCFILAAINALALPAYCASMESAPLWWSLEVPVLLAICFRSGDFFKHILVMGIWVTSGALLFVTGPTKLSLAISMAVPLSGTLIALAYRFVQLQSNWPAWKKCTSYCVYLYGSTAIALALLAVHLGITEALQYWLVASGAVLALALGLRDRGLQAIGVVVACGALFIFGAQWQTWNNQLAITVIAGCYAFSLTYRHIKNKGGVAMSPLSLFAGTQMLSEKEAGILEVGASIFGYATLIAASYLLIESPINTIAWGIEAFVLIAFGFLTARRGHRFSGLVTLFLASGKLAIFDLSGVGGGWRIVISLGAVGVCFVAAGIFYLVEYGRKSRGNQEK